MNIDPIVRRYCETSAIEQPNLRKVVQLVCEGYDNHEIGEILGLTEKTVGAYLSKKIYPATVPDASPSSARVKLVSEVYKMHREAKR